MKKLTFWELVSIGIGGMIGGGIFAVLGLSIQLSGKYAPESFLIAGAIALITSYAYHKFSLKVKSEGGTISFITESFGKNLFTGWINVILWISYLIMLSLYSYAFGSYFVALFGLHGALWKHIGITLPIVTFFVINLLGSKIVGESEKYIVAFKVSILLLFVVMGAFAASGHVYQPTRSLTGIISGGMLIFLAYEGFELIANAAKDARSERELSLAFYVSVILVILIYFFVALVTVDTLSYSKVISARDYVLAEAAKPFLGYAGFVLISFAALLSTSSAINATLYGSSRISYILMKLKELPEIGNWKGNVEGLVATTVLVILIANLFNLSSISLIGSAGFLIIFAVVNFAAVKKSKELNANKFIPLIGGLMCLGSLSVLLYRVISFDLFGLEVLAGIIIFALVFEWVLEKFKFGKKATHL